MYTSSTARKRARPTTTIGRCQREESPTKNGHLEKWFSRHQEQMVVYLHEINRKVISSPKFLKFSWLKDEKMQDIRRMLKN